MRILLLTPQVPMLPSTGGSPRVYHLLKELSKRHDFLVYCFVHSELEKQRFFQSPEVKEIYSPINIVEVNEKRSLNGFVLTSFSPYPNFITKYNSPKAHIMMKKSVRVALKDHSIDLIHVDSIKMLQYLPDKCEIPKVVVLPDSLFLYFKRGAKSANGFLKRIWLGFQAIKMRAFEVDALQKVDHVVVNSKVDKKFLLEQGLKTDITVVPNGVDTDYYCNRTAQRDEHSIPTLVFTGVMNYEFNADAMLYFCRQIFPLIKRKIPDVKLQIVGKDPSKSIKVLSKDPSVYVTGYVRDVRPYIAKAHVCVFPLRGGAGMKNKILTAMAMRKPVVATTISFDGIDVVADRDVLIADTPQSFAKKTVELINNRQLQNVIADNAYELVKSKYRWEAYQESFNAIYEEVSIKNSK